MEATTEFHRNGLPYLYAELPNGQAWVGSGAHIASQLFRKVIARACGESEAFDWKSHAFESNVHETIRRIAQRRECVADR
jgi:hypothetical protein